MKHIIRVDAPGGDAEIEFTNEGLDNMNFVTMIMPDGTEYDFMVVYLVALTKSLEYMREAFE